MGVWASRVTRHEVTRHEVTRHEVTSHEVTRHVSRVTRHELGARRPEGKCNLPQGVGRTESERSTMYGFGIDETLLSGMQRADSAFGG